jgi:serine/threonine-protein kinase RsbT
MAEGGRPPGKGPGATTDAYARILKVLSKFMSEGSAMAAIARAERSTGLDVRRLQSTDAAVCFSAIERAAAMTLDRKSQALLHGELEFELSVVGSESAPIIPKNQSIAVRTELEATFARRRAREVVTALGGKSYDAVKAMTLVSELARNIVLYTPGGRIELRICDSPRSLIVHAADEGPGISNLNEVFSGRYRSKTGLGKGLLGAKRLSDRFEIRTDASGTRIEAEVRF